jgi:hypothetical protein
MFVPIRGGGCCCWLIGARLQRILTTSDYSIVALMKERVRQHLIFPCPNILAAGTSSRHSSAIHSAPTGRPACSDGLCPSTFGVELGILRWAGIRNIGTTKETHADTGCIVGIDLECLHRSFLGTWIQTLFRSKTTPTTRRNGVGMQRARRFVDSACASDSVPGLILLQPSFARASTAIRARKTREAWVCEHNTCQCPNQSRRMEMET